MTIFFANMSVKAWGGVQALADMLRMLSPMTGVLHAAGCPIASHLCTLALYPLNMIEISENLWGY